MLAIAMYFLAGRYHATPWGRHVNEAAPEWPPSPWRLLRSLVATWKLRVPALPEDLVRQLLMKLAGPPQFHLPRASLGHSRHYMPWFKKGPDDRTMVFDGFVVVSPDEPVVWIWDQVKLTDDERVALSTLLEHLAYFGRAESWCRAELLDSLADPTPNAYPATQAAAPGGELQLVRVLCADPKTAFDPISTPGTSARRSRRQSTQLSHSLDPPWNLCVDTPTLHNEGWSDPPGSKWIDYLCPADCFRPLPTKRRRPTRQLQIQVARYVLDGTVLPPVTETLTFAERVRQRLMGIYGKLTAIDGQPGRSRTFSGKDADGNPLQGHQHAYYLPTDEDGDGRIDHLTVVAEAGFAHDEVRALDRLRELYTSDREDTIRLVLIALGKLEDFCFGPLASSTHWVSATPFIVTRHPKKNGRKRDPLALVLDRASFVEQVLREELDRLCSRKGWAWGAAQLSVQRVEDPPGVFVLKPQLWRPGATGPRLRPLQFKRFRLHKPEDDGGRRPAGSFLIEFPEAIKGPVVLGHSAHFGMGLFLPILRKASRQGAP